MGNTTGSINNNNSVNLYDNIRKQVSDLIYKYEFWTNNEICDKLTIVYYDKLIQFPKTDLLDASSYIGIKNDIDKKIDKAELCSKIINHYKNRIDLLKEIMDSVDKSYRRLNQAK